MTQKVRLSIQIFALSLSALLLLGGVWRFNLLFILSSLVAALVAGRVFCSWLMPAGLLDRTGPSSEKTGTFPAIILEGRLRQRCFYADIYLRFYYPDLCWFGGAHPGAVDPDVYHVYPGYSARNFNIP